MSPLALGMDILLAALLAAALFIGARLNSRLAALREGQAGFARAVGDLNAAAARADSALKALRTASEETHDALLDRISTARALIERLDAAAAAAERSQRRHESPASSRLTGLLEAVGRAGLDDDLLEPAPRARAVTPSAPAPAPARDPADRPPLRRTLSELLAARGRPPAPEVQERPAAPTARRRPTSMDEDLFVDLDDAHGAFDRAGRRT